MNLLRMVTEQAIARLPESVRATLFVWGFGATKVPLIFLVAPKVEVLAPERCVVRLPLNWLTRNHLGSMYMGALAVGADIAGGLIAFDAVHRTGADVSLVFKDLQANFKRRPERAVTFACEDGLAIRDAVAQADASGERVELPVTVTARTRDAEIASFILTLSLKRRTRK